MNIIYLGLFFEFMSKRAYQELSFLHVLGFFHAAVLGDKQYLDAYTS